MLQQPLDCRALSLTVNLQNLPTRRSGASAVGSCTVYARSRSPEIPRLIQDRENVLSDPDLNRTVKSLLPVQSGAEDKSYRLLRQSTSRKNSVQSCGCLLKNPFGKLRVQDLRELRTPQRTAGDRSVGQSLESFLIQLQEARAEWRRGHPI